jgi:hypothetical protein
MALGVSEPFATCHHLPKRCSQQKDAQEEIALRKTCRLNASERVEDAPPWRHQCSQVD